MPWHEPVEQGEANPGDAAGDQVAPRRLLAKPVTETLRRAGSVGLFPRPVHVAERPERVGCVPGIE